MKILVCVKQVLDGEAPVRVEASGRWFAPEATPVWRMNAFDAFAVEEALRIRERVPDTTIDAISVGPGRVAAVLKRALEMGANEGIHWVTESEGRLSPRAVAAAIAAWAGPRHYDLILTGAMSEDVMDAQVGPMLAALLGLPWATAVMRMDLSGRTIDAPPRPAGPEATGSPDRPSHPAASPDAIDVPPRTLYVERELEGGVREALVLDLPALVAVQSGINRPRYPALSHVLRARKQPLIVPPAAPTGAGTEWERVVGVYEPAAARTGQFLEGSPEDKARRLIALLKEKALL